jgi:hypothetical protein
MPCLLLLLWLSSAIALWVWAIRGFREASAEADDARAAAIAHAVVFAAAPPTLVFLVSAFVLLQAAPTVQFNAGSSWAMELWSFWVRNWLGIFVCSGIQTACYFVWFIGSLVTRTRTSVRCTVGFAFLSSVWGSLLLSMAYPTA